MPYPVQITVEAIAYAARDIIESKGLENFTFKQLAEELNVSPPAIYRLVRDKSDLLYLVRLAVYSNLLTEMRQAIAVSTHPCECLLAFSIAYRTYMARYPITTALLFSKYELHIEKQTMLNANDQMFKLIQEKMIRLTGNHEDSISACMGLWSLIHGFVVLENGDCLVPYSETLDERFVKQVKSYLMSCVPS